MMTAEVDMGREKRGRRRGLRSSSRTVAFAEVASTQAFLRCMALTRSNNVEVSLPGCGYSKSAVSDVQVSGCFLLLWQALTCSGPCGRGAATCRIPGYSQSC
mmetsp:Transcript_88343/g.258224  ORF Transcript_88343/g.258224 Transcript_88343/m.258224 type:complete len:102 (+) Transcript_88343:1735-2040(+)